ncbi:class I SAM-dependent methyltransferase [Azospirillum sp. TSA6c]|uniref:class I SAM-dependent methyltransferase n=1 Tax=unclassified Azospirillum TaxID=2630922 RepID=UPI000D65CC3B|nr:class I SAM-dependent methyltransferase [Azospirillum sp. TSA6c]
MTGTLVFPSSVAAALDYVRDATNRGEQLVGASSLLNDENAASFPIWEHLPPIHDASFPAAVSDLVARHRLTHVYAPVTAVHAALTALINDGHLPLRMVRPNPVAEQAEAVRRSLKRAETLHGFMEEILVDEPARQRLLSLLTAAAVLRHANSLYGESSDVKLAAMLAVAASVPQGDVVEIGTLMGKSASVLILSARLYNIGKVLTIDPWTPAQALQADSPQLIQDLAGLWDFDMLVNGYYLNTLPISAGCSNHLRLTSEDGFAAYVQNRRVESPELGCTDYSGRIALLHIDGNHDLAAVQKDWDNWGSRMLPGGWVIFDDYTWIHGTGPRTVGDQVLAQSEAWRRSFVCGGALFVQVA